ncbi:hypothetical protein [Mycobacterium shigaense]|uniref:hypothetical protein n=1 Tax=Mycobacterium shigaense TaxID=722731 RepID=UPI002AE04153|nr:hypothetical protein [Mycobacterium shigaense]MEA1121183.1 hypothetical protein [Mycobacterium shigaense]
MTTIERFESTTEQHDEIAVTIVDTDVHPLPVSAEVLKSYAPPEWVDKIWPTGNGVAPSTTPPRATACRSPRT